MRFEVRVIESVAAELFVTYGPQRSASGSPSEWDFWSGPLQAATLAFRAFDALPFDDIEAIRRFELIDPVFGVVAFFGVLVAETIVEIAAFSIDPDYWELVDDDPDD